MTTELGSYTLVMHTDPSDAPVHPITLEVLREPRLRAGEAHWYSCNPGVLYCGQRAYDVLKALPEAKQKELTFPDLTARPA